MLAYVFWHWPQNGTDHAAYERRLAHFQAALAASRPPGLHDAAVFRLAAAPWIQAPGYEEWYLLEGSAALDPLNEAAVSPACRAAHDGAAVLAGGGAAGLYRLRAGCLLPHGARFSYWLSKPSGASYAQFYASLEPLTGQGGTALWGRQMVLGPTPEFCLHSQAEAEIPPGLLVMKNTLEPVWMAS